MTVGNNQATAANDRDFNLTYHYYLWLMGLVYRFPVTNSTTAAFECKSSTLFCPCLFSSIKTMHRTPAHQAPPMLELDVQNRPDSPGAQLPRRQSGGMGPISLSNLPRDVILGVLDEIRPVGPLTAYVSAAEKPMVSSGHLECRTSLLNVCLASKAFYELAIPHLYRNPLIKDRWELFRFFCTLAKQVHRRPMVRSFAWAGVMWEADMDVGSSIRRLEDEALISVECWDSIKDEWPRDPLDLEIAKLSEYDAPDTDRTCCPTPEVFSKGVYAQRHLLFKPIVPETSSQCVQCSLCPQRHSQNFHQFYPSMSRTCKPTSRTSGGFVVHTPLYLFNITDLLLGSGH